MRFSICALRRSLACFICSRSAAIFAIRFALQLLLPRLGLRSGRLQLLLHRLDFLLQLGLALGSRLPQFVVELLQLGLKRGQLAHQLILDDFRAQAPEDQPTQCAKSGIHWSLPGLLHLGHYGGLTRDQGLRHLVDKVDVDPGLGQIDNQSSQTAQ